MLVGAVGAGAVAEEGADDGGVAVEGGKVERGRARVADALGGAVGCVAAREAGRVDVGAALDEGITLLI